MNYLLKIFDAKAKGRVLLRVTSAILAFLALALGSRAYAENSNYNNSAVVVELRDGVYVDNSSVSLADAVRCINHVAICDEFYAVEIAEITNPGKSIAITEHTILDIVGKEWGNYTFEFVGRRSTTIRSHFRNVTKDDIISEINLALKGFIWPEYVSEVRVKDIYGFTSLKLWPQSYSVELEGLNEDTPPSSGGDLPLSFVVGLKKLRVTVKQDDLPVNFRRTYDITPHFDIFAKVFAVRKPVTKGEGIQEEDLQIITENFSRWHDLQNTVTSIDSLQGMTIRRSIGSGTILRHIDFNKDYLVKKGSAVELISKRGSLEVRVKGKALESGSRGDLLKFQNAFSRKIVVAEVMSATEAFIKTKTKNL